MSHKVVLNRLQKNASQMAQETYKCWTIYIFNKSKNSVSWLAERLQLSLLLLEK